MKVKATISQQVEIDPKEVVQKLLEKELPLGSYIDEMGEKIYKYSDGFNNEEPTEITKEKHDYIKALELVLKNLK